NVIKYIGSALPGPYLAFRGVRVVAPLHRSLGRREDPSVWQQLIAAARRTPSGPPRFLGPKPHPQPLPPPQAPGAQFPPSWLSRSGSIAECRNNEHPGTDQQGYDNTPDDRKNRMPAFGRFRLRSRMLPRCNTHQELTHGFDTSVPVCFRGDVRWSAEGLNVFREPTTTRKIVIRE